VHVDFGRRRDDGTWRRMVDAWRERVRTEVARREATPSSGGIDGQSVKAAGQSAADTGDDGAKNLTGRKRYLAVDPRGLLLVAAIDDAAAAPQVLAQPTAEQFPRRKVIWADSQHHNHPLRAWIESDPARTWSIEVKKRPQEAIGFVLPPKRWVVARTHAWMGRCRRHNRDDERHAGSRAARIQLTAMNGLLQRLAPNHRRRPFKYRPAVAA
jgi:transposase